MKNLTEFVNYCYGIAAMLALGVGAVVFFVFVAGLVVGGPTGTKLAITAKNWMMFGIKIASLSTFLGIVNIYLNKSHTLTIDQG
ncbi:MAG: hypothetical protein ACM3X4_07795 [Ignavibacteriales bacterium]